MTAWTTEMGLSVTGSPWYRWSVCRGSRRPALLRTGSLRLSIARCELECLGPRRLDTRQVDHGIGQRRDEWDVPVGVVLLSEGIQAQRREFIKGLKVDVWRGRISPMV